jgi:hypothetical protein
MKDHYTEADYDSLDRTKAEAQIRLEESYTSLHSCFLEGGRLVQPVNADSHFGSTEIRILAGTNEPNKIFCDFPVAPGELRDSTMQE